MPTYPHCRDSHWRTLRRARAGSETGHDTEAKSTIWTDREGFDARFEEFGQSVDAAIASDPQTLESLNAVMKPIFKECKSCHEGFRVEKD